MSSSLTGQSQQASAAGRGDDGAGLEEIKLQGQQGSETPRSPVSPTAAAPDDVPEPDGQNQIPKPQVIDVYMFDRCQKDKMWKMGGKKCPKFEDDNDGRKAFQWKIQQIPKVKPMTIVLSVGWGMLMALLDMTIVSVALVDISHFFVKSETEVQWVVDGYSICLAAVSIIAGKVGDKFGSVNVNHIGMILFMVFSVTCTLAPPSAFWVLVVSRLLQGASASFLMSTTMSTATTLVEPLDISRVMADISVLMTVATALGPLLGGILTESLGWQAVFIINVPLGIIGMIVTMSVLPKMPHLKEKKFDWVGGIVTLIFLALLVFGVAEIIREPVFAGICIGISAVLIVFFCFWERRHPSPVIAKVVLFDRRVMSSLIGGIFNFAGSSIISYQAPFLLQYCWGYSPSIAGLIALPSAFATAACGLIGGWLCRRYSATAVRWMANCLSLIGFVLAGVCAIIPGGWGLFVYIMASMIVFAGMGIFVTASNTYIMVTTPVNAKGATGGAVQCFRETGFSMGVALSCVFGDVIKGGIWGDDIPVMDSSMPDDYKWSFERSFMWMCLSFFVMVWFAAILTVLAGWHPYEVEKGFKLIPASTRAKLQKIVDECHKNGVDALGRPWPSLTDAPPKPKKRRHFGRDPRRVAEAKAARDAAHRQAAEQSDSLHHTDLSDSESSMIFVAKSPTTATAANNE